MKNTEKYIKYGFYAAAAVAVFLVLKKLGVFKSKLEREGEVNIAESLTTLETANAKNNATLSEAQLRGLASKIKSSWHWYNDEEGKIYAAFESLNNYYDLLLLTKYYGLNGGASLEDDITKRLSNNEINKINEILNNKGINFNF